MLFQPTSGVYTRLVHTPRPGLQDPSDDGLMLRTRKGRCVEAGCRPALNTCEENLGTVSRMDTGTFSSCGAETLLGKAYLATPLGGRLGYYPPTLDLPRRTAAYLHLPKVPLNNGLSDDLNAVSTVTTVSQS